VASDPGFAETARRQAHQILSHAPYTNNRTATPRPLAGVLHAVGHALDIVLGPVGRWLGRSLFGPIGHGFTSVFGGWATAVGIVLALGAGIVLAMVLVRRRSRLAAHRAPESSAVPPLDPADLEEQAERRASVGDFASALRLRFEAGLLRLEVAGLLADHGVRTDSQVSAAIGSPTFELLARRHEAVAYGGDPARAPDVEQARTGWPRVPQEARDHRALADSGQP